MGIVLKQRLRYSHKVVKNKPLTLLSAILAFCFFIFAMEFQDSIKENIWMFSSLKANVFYGLGIISLLGISLFYCLELLSEILTDRRIPYLGWLILFIYGLILPLDIERWQLPDQIIAASLFVLQHLLVSFLPNRVAKKTDIEFWSFQVNLIFHLLKSLFFTLILFGGLALAIAAIENLFNLTFTSDKTYAYISLFAFTIALTFVFLLFEADGFTSLISQASITKELHFFSQYALRPLLALYGLILYTYSIKIWIEWNLPKGWVSYLVLAYSLAGLIDYVLVYPNKHRRLGFLDNVFSSRTFFIGMIPLLVLLYIAIGTRLTDYGITPNRYYLFLIALWLSLVTLYLLFSKTRSIQFLPISLFFLLLLGIITPYFNAISMSQRSQLKHFHHILVENGLLSGDTIDFKRPVPFSEYQRLISISEVLHSLGIGSDLMSYVDKGRIKENNPSGMRANERFSNFYNYFENIIYEDFAHSNLRSFTVENSIYAKNKIIKAKGADYVLFISAHSGYHETFVIDSFQLAIKLGGRNVENKSVNLNITLRETSSNTLLDSVALDGYILEVYDRHIDKDPEEYLYLDSDLNTRFSLGKFALELEFVSIQFQFIPPISSGNSNSMSNTHNVIEFYPTFYLKIKKGT